MYLYRIIFYIYTGKFCIFKQWTEFILSIIQIKSKKSYLSMIKYYILVQYCPIPKEEIYIFYRFAVIK
jgi:hypothetical protein